jgi:hypothetical protein
MKFAFKNWFGLLLACAMGLGHASAADYHVAPNGSASGDGSTGQPWDLHSALLHPAALKPGDTMWLHGGTYTTTNGTVNPHSFDCLLNGSRTGPIVLRQMPGEIAVVDGGIECRPGSGWYHFRDFRVTCSDANRLVLNGAHQRPNGVFISGVGVKLINLVIDNASTGVFWADSGLPEGDDGEIYGCIIYGNGVYDASTAPGTAEDPWTRGSAIYAQNANGKRTIADNICFRNFTTGPLVYAEEGRANGFQIEGNISFDPAGGAAIEAATKNHPSTSITILSNACYSPRPGNAIRLGYQSRSNQNAVVEGNYAAGAGAGTTGLFSIKNWETARIRNNLFYSWGGNKAVASIDREGGLKGVEMDWDRNTYFASNFWCFVSNNVLPSLPFEDWQKATGYDKHSVYSNSAPPQVTVITRRNKYDPLRSHVAVFNWGEATKVDFDLRQVGIRAGIGYEIRDAQNFFGPPVASGVSKGEPVSIPLNSTAVAPIHGPLKHFTNQHTAAEFNAFVVFATVQSSGNGRGRGR